MLEKLPEYEKQLQAIDKKLINPETISKLK